MNFDVLVVGAGPTGLLLAIELAMAGVRPLVVERLREPDLTIKAGAIGVLAGETLERRGFGPAMADEEKAAFDALLPDVRAVLGTRRFGGHFAGIFYRTGKKEPQRRFRGIMQAPLERLLSRRASELGIAVRRGVEMVGFHDRGSDVEVELRDGETNRTSSLRVAYLVGCDGGRSRVRKLAGFEFPGTAPSITGWQAIVEVDAPDALAAFRWTRMPGGMVTWGPVPGRLFLCEFDGPPEDREAPITIDELQGALTRITQTDVRITALETATRFTDHARQATSYRKGRIFLAGDAAHVHSPFGGQGINLGLVDAANLGWKLARAARGRGGARSERLLDSYTTERHPVAARALDATRAQIALMRPDVYTTPLRSLMSDLMKLDDVNEHIVELMSGLGTRYDLDDDHPDVGRLAPNVVLELPDRETDLYALMQEGDAVLFGPSNDLEAAAAGRARFVRTRGGPSMLVRPDGCIAWASQEGEEGPDARLTRAVDRWLAA